MKKNHLVLLLLPLYFISCKTEDLDPSFTKEFSISSVEKGKTYTIWVHLPEDYNSTTSTYSTIYVLDAKENQEYVAQTCKKISKDLNTSNVIVVGIGYGDDRQTDYTPTDIGKRGKGEGPKFLSFIKKELIPKIEKDFRADSQRSKRIIIGHSLGGLFGAFAFTKDNDIFGNYLLLSPSLFYDNDIVLQYEQASRATIKDKQQLVYIGAGGMEGPLLVGNSLLHERLINHYPQTKTAFDVIKGKAHVSSKNTTIKKSLEFYFHNR